MILLNPFAPHTTEEMYEMMGYEGVLNEQKWPEYEEALCIDQTVEIVCQINGKVKAKLNIAIDANQDSVIAQAKTEPEIVKLLEGKTIIKEIYVLGRLVNLVVK